MLWTYIDHIITLVLGLTQTATSGPDPEAGLHQAIDRRDARALNRRVADIVWGDPPPPGGMPTSAWAWARAPLPCPRGRGHATHRTPCATRSVGALATPFRDVVHS